jgi:hypothetical protein
VRWLEVLARWILSRPSFLKFRYIPGPYWLCRYDLKVCDDGTSEIGTCSIDWTQLSKFYLKTEIESSLRNVVF